MHSWSVARPEPCDRRHLSVATRSAHDCDYVLYLDRPRRLLGQVAVELGEQLLLILAGERAGEEPVDAFVVEPLPTGFFGAGIDREEERVVGLRPPCSRPGRRRSSACGPADTSSPTASDSFFVPTSWPQIATTYCARSCSSHSRSSASCGVAETTSMSALPASFSRLSRTNGNGGTPRTMPVDRLVDRLRPVAASCVRSGSPVSSTAFSSAGLPSFVSSLHPLDAAPGGMSIFDAAGLHLRPLLQPLERLDQRRKAIDAAALASTG